MLSMCIITSSLSDIHLQTYRMTCLGFLIISWASFFSSFSRDGERLSRLLLADGNEVSTSSEGGGEVFVTEEESLVCFLGDRYSTEVLGKH